MAYPLDGRPYRDLGGIAEREGHDLLARQLFDIAIQRSPRDPTARTELLEYALNAHDLPGVMHQMDILMRIDPSTIATLGPGLVSLSRDPVALRQLGRMLAARPPWRLAFLGMTVGLTVDPPLIDRVFASRGGNDALPSGGTESDLLLQRQIGDGRWDSAHATWAQALSKAQQAVAGLVYDGSFAFAPTGKGFDWQFPVDGTGYDVIVRPAESGKGNVMQVRFDGLPMDYRPVRQRLVLAPGHYRLSGMVGSSGLDDEGGLYWEVACDEGRAEKLGSSDMTSGEAHWHAFAMEFDVPVKECGTQWLRLALAVGDSMAQPLQGSATFSGIAITRLDEPKPSSPTAANASAQ